MDVVTPATGPDMSATGLAPLSTQGTGQPTKPKKKPETQSDPVDAYLAEHPESTPATEAATPEVATPPVAEPAAPVEPPAPGAEPVEAKTKLEAKPAAEKPSAEPIAAEPKPAAPAAEPTPEPKNRFAPDERIALAANVDGSAVEWTRAQVVAGLQERAKFQPLAAEAEQFRDIFGMDAKTAAAQWTPMLKQLADDLPTAQLITATLEDAPLAAYLRDCASHFAAERAAGNVPQFQKPQPAQPAPDAELRREVAEMRKWRERQERTVVEQQVNGEIASAILRYPFLATDRGLMQDLLASANALNSMDAAAGVAEHQRRGIPAAMAAKASVYDALLTARAVSAPQQQPAAVPTLPVAATAPGGTRTPADNRPRKFDDLGDAVEDYLRNNPQ